MSQRPSRIIVMPLRQAWPWRRDLALLEIGCRHGWRLPALDVITDGAEALAAIMRSQEAIAVLAFEGYTLVGACWCREGCLADASALPTGLHGPFVMPHVASDGLAQRLQQQLALALH